MSRTVTFCAIVLSLGACETAPMSRVAVRTDSIRVATYNVQELSLSKLEHIDRDGRGADSQLMAAAGVIRRLRPDVLLLNEVDFDEANPARPARLFAERHLRDGSDGIVYPYVFTAPSNTGMLSGFDLDRNGLVADSSLRGQRAHGDDSWGFGVYPGQYGMVILSRFPIDTSGVRTFQYFRWRDLPGHHMPVGFWPDSVASQVRLSSKSHWDVPVVVGTDTLHVLASHPTPPAFDGPEDRNGRRNFDEIGFWMHYLDGHPAITDDRDGHGGMAPGRQFVIMGDLNADPERADTTDDGLRAMAQILGHPGVQQAAVHRGIPTATFLGGTRVDYVLPSRGLRVIGGGVFDPDRAADPTGAAMAGAASDHRMVWLDLRWPPE